MPRKKLPYSASQIAALHECWKEAHSGRSFLELAAARIPAIPPPAAMSLVRRLSRSDPAWQATARQKERERDERKLVKERARQDKLKRRNDRQMAQEWKGRREAIRSALVEANVAKVVAIVGTGFFFCADTRQQVCRLSCVFRVFSGDDRYGFSHGGPCERCERMDEHIPALERIIGGSER